MRTPRLGGRRVVIALAVGAAVAAAVAAVVMLALPDGGERGRSTLQGTPPVEAEVALAPRILLFGDTLTARIDVTVDRSRVDPDSVRIVQEFSPWSVIGEPALERTDSKGVSHVVARYVLRCVISPCVPPRDVAQLEFDRAQVRFAIRHGGRLVQRSVNVRWPVLVVHSRFVSSDFDRREALSAPWKADLETTPAVSFRIGPDTAYGLLIGVGALLLALGLALVVVGFPRRAQAPPPEPAPEPLPVLPPLEQALALLEDPERTNGAADQRRALELVAEEMALRGDAQLERTARALAWSEDVPAIGETSGLAALVRTALEAEAVERAAAEAERTAPGDEQEGVEADAHPT